MRFKLGDVVVVPGKNKIKATVLKQLSNVVMVCPWNCGREDLFFANDLKHTGERQDLIGISDKERRY